MHGHAVGPDAVGPRPDLPPLLELVEVMRRLRAECPWKAEQTHRSLTRYLLEEAHEVVEVLDALEPGEAADGRGRVVAGTAEADHLAEELGDLLLQVLFHASIAEEAGAFDVDDVARGLTAKMVRRNPHVFGDEPTPGDARAVDDRWQQLKAQEKAAERDGAPLTRGLAPSLPALLYADKVVDRLGRAGRAVPEAAREGLGGRLLALVEEAHAAGVDPEQALRDAVRLAVAD